MGFVPFDLAAGTLVVDAWHLDSDPSVPAGVSASVIVGAPVAAGSFDHPAAKAVAADWLAARFPKAVGIKPTSLSVGAGSLRDRSDWGCYPYGSFSAHLVADGVNGGWNAAGVKRFRRLLAAAAAAGVPVVYRGGFSNSYASLDDVLAVLDAGAASDR